MDHPTVTRATYNICNDRLKVWFAERLPKAEYDEAKRLGFVYWFVSKCLTCTWRPQAEDFITSRGIVIEDDDQPDDTEARVDRFSKYAENAEQSANGAADRLDSGAANTERRRRLALNRAENETDKAAHWQRRIEAAIRHASFKEQPDVIVRRIQGLESDARRYEAAFTPHTDKAGEVIRYQGQVICGPKGRGAHAVKESELPALAAHYGRWLAHVSDRLMYERAALAAAGGVQAEMMAPGGVLIEVGGAVLCDREWREVIKVNPSTVEIYDPSDRWQKFRKICKTTIKDVATKLRVDAGEIYFHERAPKIEKPKAGKTQTSKGGTPEKFGAFGSSGAFSDDLSKPVRRWYLITKVNAKTVEYVYSFTETIQQADSTTKPRKGFYVKKDEIYGLDRLLTAAQVKAEHPELLVEFAEYQDLCKRIEARKAERAAAKAAQPVAGVEVAA